MWIARMILSWNCFSLLSRNMIHDGFPTDSVDNLYWFHHPLMYVFELVVVTDVVTIG